MQPSHSSHCQRVIVVDDNVGAALMLSKLVRMVGNHEVEMAHDGPSALKKIRELRPDLVFLDIGLPGLDGHQVAQDIRNDPTCVDVFLVALTGYGEEDDLRKSEAAGIDEHLVKPPSIKQIQEIFAHPKLAEKHASNTLESQTSSEETRSANSDAATDSTPMNGRAGIDVSRLKHDLGNTAHIMKMAVQVLSSNTTPNPAILQNVVDGLSHEVATLTRLIDKLQALQDTESKSDSNNLTADSIE